MLPKEGRCLRSGSAFARKWGATIIIHYYSGFAPNRRYNLKSLMCDRLTKQTATRTRLSSAEFLRKIMKHGTIHGKSSAIPWPPSSTLTPRTSQGWSNVCIVAAANQHLQTAMTTSRGSSMHACSTGTSKTWCGNVVRGAIIIIILEHSDSEFTK